MATQGEVFIGVVTIKEGTEVRALAKLDTQILEKGQICVIWSVARNSEGAIILNELGAPTLNRKQFMVVGDGVTRFSRLEPYWPVRKESFNSIAANKVGRARDIGGNFLATNGTARYNSLDEWVDAITHPFQEPYFTSFNVGPLDPIEVGLEHDPNHAYSWVSSSESAVLPNSVSINLQYLGGNTQLLSGLPATGSFAGWAEDSVARPVIIVPTIIGSQIHYILRGISTSGIMMPEAKRSIEAMALSTWFTWPDAQALIPTLTVKLGDPGISYLAADEVKAICEDMLARSDGSEVERPDLKLGNVDFGKITIDGGPEGGRVYMLYAQDYRDSIDFLNSLGVKNAATRVMQISLHRNGVDIPYNLMAMDLRVTGKINITLR